MVIKKKKTQVGCKGIALARPQIGGPAKITPVLPLGFTRTPSNIQEHYLFLIYYFLSSIFFNILSHCI